jgi:hypothetical protein
VTAACRSESASSDPSLPVEQIADGDVDHLLAERLGFPDRLVAPKGHVQHLTRGHPPNAR